MAYFEYDLPMRAPSYLHPDIVRRFEDVMHTVAARMDKLEDARRVIRGMSSMTDAQFAASAKKLFDSFPERFEEMSSADLASVTMMMFDGATVEPRIEWPNAVTVVDTAFVTTKEWEMIRHIGIGGSDAAVVKGVSPYNTQRVLYHDKCGTPMTREDGADAIFDRGHILEPRVIATFCKVTGAKLVPETRMFRSKTHPHCTANIDAIVRFPDGRLFCFEAKTTKRENWEAWANGRIPVHYVPQTMQYPAVMNDDRILGTYIGCLFTVDYVVKNTYLGSTYDPQQFVCRLVERDLPGEERLLDANEAFFKEYIEAQVVPPASFAVKSKTSSADKLMDAELVERLSGPADKSAAMVDLDTPQLKTAADLFLELKEQKKALTDKAEAIEKQKKALSLSFIEALGSAVDGIVPLDDKRVILVRYYPCARTVVDTETLAIKYPEAFLECVQQNPCATRKFEMTIKDKVRLKSAKAS